MQKSFLNLFGRFPRRLLFLMTLLMGVTQGGCALLPEPKIRIDPAQLGPTVYERQRANRFIPNGAIYQSTTSNALFEDQKAKRIGDILTINLVESTNATKNSTTTTSKSTDTNIVNAQLFGVPVTLNGNELLSGSLNGEQGFSGEGGATQSNRLEGSVTVTVIDQKPNGNLVVQGEKWLTLNQGQEFVRVSGIVRPIDILADNSISSEKIANARIEYAGKGALADANQMSWLARFFNSPWLPF